MSEERKGQIDIIFDGLKPDQERNLLKRLNLAMRPDRIRCPKCNAGPGEWCKTPKGRLTKKDHKQRIDAARPW